MSEITEIIFPKPRNQWEKDLIMALYTLLSQIRVSIVGDGTVQQDKLTIIISETTPTGTIQSGSIWIKTSNKQAWMYVVDTWVPLAGS